MRKGKVWICDFCEYADNNDEIMKIHEDKCSSNPKNKECWSCKYMQFDSGEYDCIKHLYFHNICDEWEISKKSLKKIRELKLNRILKNINV